MGQIIVRNLDDQVIARLKERAQRADQSLEQTVRDILVEAAKPSKTDLWAEIDALRHAAAMRQGPVQTALDPTVLIREDRDNDEPYR
ncbi:MULTISPECIES: hypothetical protein [Rhodomicrobium]|uniref:FitA-like ribbon-helix-helix domain-containing protein n=1 Tax=Rhodomicrobium TaxID=1068 RepID=UPI000F7396E4|nr:MULTISPECIES: hypothetical protein [Rhodomicrobium]